MANPIERFANATDYLVALQAYLEEKEAANQLLLGAARTLSAAAPQAAFYATAVSESDGWTGTALLSGGRLFAYGQTATAMQALAADLATTGNQPRSVTAPGTAAHVLADAFAAATGLGYFVGLQQRCYQQSQPQALVPPPGRMRAAREAEVGWLGSWLAALQSEAHGRQVSDSQGLAAARRLVAEGALYLWELDRPVAMLGTGLPSRHGLPLVQLYTPPAERNRGYATALVADLSRRLLLEGRAFTTALVDISAAVPTYVLLKAGFKSVTDLFTYHFAAAEPRRQSEPIQ